MSGDERCGWCGADRDVCLEFPCVDAEEFYEVLMS